MTTWYIYPKALTSLRMTRASNQNVGKLYTKYELSTENYFYIYIAASTENDVTAVTIVLHKHNANTCDKINRKVNTRQSAKWGV